MFPTINSHSDGAMKYGHHGQAPVAPPTAEIRLRATRRSEVRDDAHRSTSVRFWGSFRCALLGLDNFLSARYRTNRSKFLIHRSYEAYLNENVYVCLKI